MTDQPIIVVPGDDPPQIADSPELDRLSDRARVIVHRDRPADYEQKMSRVQDAQIILSSRSALTWREQELRSLPNLKMIATCSVGTDSIDLVTAKELGIVVSNQPGVNAPFVAEHMFGLMFAVAKQAVEQTEALKSGRWLLPVNMTLQGKRLGIVGTGSIGAEMARLGNALGMEVVAWTYHPDAERAAALGVRFVEFDELLETSDVVSLHVRLSEDSHHLIDAAALARMKPGAILLNGARGGVLDYDALVDALNRGALFGAALDVFPEEPIAADHPILKCQRVVLTPHAADQTPEAVIAVNKTAVDNIIAFLDGVPRVNAAS